MPVTNNRQPNLNVSMMKKLIFSAIFLFAAAMPSFSQVGQDLKSAGKDVKDATVTGADKTATATKKVYSKTKKGADKVADKTAPTSTASPK